MIIEVTPEDKGFRIDKFISLKTQYSRSQIQTLLKQDLIQINKKPVKKNYTLSVGDKITIQEPKPKSLNMNPINEPLEIIYDSENLIVINKPPYLAVHQDQALSHKKTLINLLIGNKIPLSQLGGETRPGIVHRLDKDTSGLLIIAKTDLGYKNIRAQFEKHEVKKTYLALALGEFEAKKGKIDAPIGRNIKDRKKMAVAGSTSAKQALSEFKILKSFYSKQLNSQVNLLEIKIPTGRTHQIRVHFSSINHPLLGDTTYGNHKINQIAQKIGLNRQFLHAHKLQFKNPVSEELIKLTSPLPQDLNSFYENLS